MQQQHTPTAINEVIAERARQDAKWGGPEHDDEHVPYEWADLVGARAVQAQLDARAIGPNYRRRMIQVAALAVAAVEAFDRAAKATQQPAPTATTSPAPVTVYKQDGPPARWVVEAARDRDGNIEMTAFYGDNAEQRAKAYAGQMQAAEAPGGVHTSDCGAQEKAAWIEACAARMTEKSGIDEASAKQCAEACWENTIDHFGSEKAAADSSPEGAADAEMENWTD